MTTSPMLVPLLLMTIVAPIGAIDVFYYHIWTFRLYDQPTSRWETLTHFVRAALLGLGALILFNYEPHGLWFWIIGAFLVVDFLNDIIDVSIEKASRAPMGGLPPFEYVIHTIGSAFSGAIGFAYFSYGWSLQFQPTALAPLSPDALPSWLFWMGRLLVLGGVAVTLFEMGLFACSLFCSGQQKGKLNGYGAGVVTFKM